MSVYSQAEVNTENNTIMFTEYNESETMGSSENIDQREVDTEDNSRSGVGKASKRNREINEEEIWTTVIRKSKKFGRTGSGDLTRIPEDTVEICVTCTEKLPKQFGLAKLLKSEGIQDIIRVKYINPFKALIQFSNENSAENLMQCEAFQKNGFKCQKTLEINQSFGVIRYVDLDLSEEEILEGLSSETSIIAVKRLKRKNSMDGHWEISESVRICFKGASLPAYVKIYETRAKVNPYTYPVTQCSRCWRFGHSTKMCPSNKIICPKCTKNHPNCEETNFLCNNCGGRHMAMAKICRVYIREKKIRELMAEFNCSYKRALTLYVRPSRSSSITSQDPQVQILEASQDPPVCADMSRQKYTPSYSNITRGNREKPKEKSKTIRRKEPRDDDLFECSIGNSVNQINIEDEQRQQNHLKNQKRQSIFKKLQEKIFFNENNSWGDKIKECMTIIFEEILSIIKQYFADWPCFNYLEQLWLTRAPSSP